MREISGLGYEFDVVCIMYTLCIKPLCCQELFSYTVYIELFCMHLWLDRSFFGFPARNVSIMLCSAWPWGELKKIWCRAHIYIFIPTLADIATREISGFIFHIYIYIQSVCSPHRFSQHYLYIDMFHFDTSVANIAMQGRGEWSNLGWQKRVKKSRPMNCQLWPGKGFIYNSVFIKIYICIYIYMGYIGKDYG